MTEPAWTIALFYAGALLTISIMYWSYLQITGQYPLHLRISLFYPQAWFLLIAGLAHKSPIWTMVAGLILAQIIRDSNPSRGAVLTVLIIIAFGMYLYGDHAERKRFEEWDRKKHE